MREKEIEKILVDEVKRLGGRAYKWVSPGNDGVPDRIVIFPEQCPIFVELKTDTGKLSALQKVQIQRLQNFGQRVSVVYGLMGLSEFFKRWGYPDTAERILAKHRTYGIGGDRNKN